MIEVLRDREVPGYLIDPEIWPRRPGDPPVVADVSRIATLGWTASHTLAEMTDSAWGAWELTHGEPKAAPTGTGRVTPVRR